MKQSLLISTLAALAFQLPCLALVSDSTAIFVTPEKSILWSTATNNVVSLPIVFPDGASSATLSVTGLGYEASYEIATPGDFVLTLPAASSPETENVYELSLSFDDAAATTRTARVGVVDGIQPENHGETRCMSPVTSPKWGRVKGRAVFPIPYGVTSFTVDGAEAVTGLDGAWGWYALYLRGGETADLNLDNGAAMATLYGVPEATTISIR